MTTQHTILAVSSTLAVSPWASAHGNSSDAATLYHYLSSPDHVITFCLLALAALGVGLRATRGAMQLVQRRKR